MQLEKQGVEAEGRGRLKEQWPQALSLVRKDGVHSYCPVPSCHTPALCVLGLYQVHGNPQAFLYFALGFSAGRFWVH